MSSPEERIAELEQKLHVLANLVADLTYDIYGSLPPAEAMELEWTLIDDGEQPPDPFYDWRLRKPWACEEEANVA